LLVIALRDLDGIARIDEVDKIDAFHHAPRRDIEAGDDASGQLGVVQYCVGLLRHVVPSSSAISCAAAKSSVPSYRLRPRMAPSTPSSSTAHNASISRRSVTPPDAMMGMDTCRASLTVASMLTPDSMPSRPTSV